MNKYQSTQTATSSPPPPAYSDRSFLHTYMAGAFLPLVQSAITALMAAIGMAALLYLFNAIDYIKPVLFTFGFVWVITWLYLQRRWINLTALEKTLRMDINGDGQIGEPPKKVTITVNRVLPNKHLEQMKYDFPVSDQQIERFFTTVKTSTRGGKAISRRQWTPKNVHGFSEGEWDAFLSELVKQRLVTMRSGECVLNEDGEEIADGWYSRAHEEPPSPTDEEG